MADKHDTAVIVFARAPVPGASKTRLIPALGERGAATLHARMIERSIETLATGTHTLQLWCAPDTGHPLFEDLARRHDLKLHTQCGDDLGARMYHALDTALRDHAQAIIVGTDCPGMAAADIEAATQALQQGADDAIYEQTRARIEALGWRCHALRTLADVDRPDDLVHVPAKLLQDTRENA